MTKKKTKKTMLSAFSIILIMIGILAIVSHLLPQAQFVNDEIVNGSCLLTSSNVDYIVFSNDLIDEDKSLELVSLITEYKNTNNERVIGEIEDLIGDYTNFFFKKTIFMVKKNDK